MVLRLSAGVEDACENTFPPFDFEIADRQVLAPAGKSRNGGISRKGNSQASHGLCGNPLRSGATFGHVTSSLCLYSPGENIADSGIIAEIQA